MNHLKLCAYVLCGMNLVYAHGVAAQEGDACEQRTNELRGRFAERYLELDLKCGRVGPCYGTPDLQAPPSISDSAETTPPAPLEGGKDASGDDSSGGGKVGVCGHPASPECNASYEALTSEEAAAWEALYTECPDLVQPTPIDGIGSGDISASGPLFRAPTGAELLKRVKSLEKKLVRAKKEAKRGKARRCLVPRTR